jgi:hypothetical protein
MAKLASRVRHAIGRAAACVRDASFGFAAVRLECFALAINSLSRGAARR